VAAAGGVHQPGLPPLLASISAARLPK
jgi:hypothetical protein